VKISGAEIFIECLKAENVDTIFGYPGGAVLFLYDALYKAEARGEIRHILARHEQGATHAAEGYAKSTDKPGVCIVTSGPGATNAVTGIADAYMDSVPLVVITGQVPRALIGNDSFQEIDIVGITRPCVKHNFLVTKIEDIAPTMRKAFYLATTGRPGPVLVDIPKDLTNGVENIEFKYPKDLVMRSYQPTIKGNKKQIKTALDMIAKAKKPVLYAGGGVISSKASKELTEFGRAFNFPVTNTLMGLGTYPSNDKQFIGMLGMHGTLEANRAMHHADLIIAVGARFDDRVTGDLKKFSPTARVIHIDIDPASISKNVKAHNPIVGDIKQVLQEFAAMMIEKNINPDKTAFDAWWKEIKGWQSLDCLKYDQGDDFITAQYVVEKLWEVTKGDAYVASDVGQHQMFAAQYYKFNKPNRWVNSGGLGTMGFGLPAAMGIQLAHPDEVVTCITGDGSIQMCIQELGTCKQYNLPLNIINLNNGYLGMVRQWQEFFYEERYAMTYNESLPDFVKLAEAYGHVGIHIDKPRDVEAALREAVEDTKRLYFLDFKIEQQGNVYPMIPAGYGHNEMYLCKQDAIDDANGKK
jgi:acetolactate synthase-1/2/3 large subunit